MILELGKVSIETKELRIDGEEDNFGTFTCPEGGPVYPLSKKNTGVDPCE